MPAPGDQHSSIANPFEEPKRIVSQYTAQEIATLQSRLEKQLGPEYISARQGPSGQKVHYITAEKCIALANEVFGFNGWSSSIQNIQIDFCDEHPQTLKISLGLSVIVRVTLRDGTFHEDIGYGHIENCKGKAAAFEKAKKEGTTDALKRALRNFGNVLGNCIYDKAYLAKVTKMKVAPTKFDVDGLHRHADFVVKKETTEVETPKPEGLVQPQPPPQSLAHLIPSDSFEDFLGELDEADFNITEGGNPDEVLLPASNTSSNERYRSSTSNNNTGMQPPQGGLARSGSTGSIHPRQPQTPHAHAQPQPRHVANSSSESQTAPSNASSRPQAQQLNQRKQPVPQQINRPTGQPLTVQPTAAPQPVGLNNAAAPETVGFFSARAVKHLPEEAIASGNIALGAAQTFNIHAESPSIRKTPGIDHSRSKPLAKNGHHVPPAVSGDAPSVPGSTPGGLAGPRGIPRQGPPMSRGNIINPQLDQSRRIGVPGSPNPMANRGQYRPPTMKRPMGEEGAPGLGRAPLADVPSNVPATGNTNGPDLKRQKIG